MYSHIGMNPRTVMMVSRRNSERFKQYSATEHVIGNLRGTSVRAAFYTASGGGVDFVVRIASTAILARLISPEHFGLFTMVTAVTAFADQFRDLGLSAATVQREKITEDEVTNLFWVNLLAGLLVAVVIGACAPAVSAFYREPRLTAITLVIATGFIWGGLTVQHESLLSRQMKLGKTALVRLLANILSTIFAIILAWQGYGYWALTWREVSRAALIAIGMWLFCPWIPGLPRRKTPIKTLLGFGGNLTISHIVGTMVGSMDRVLIGKFFGAAPVAMYRQAYQLVVAPMDQLLSPIYHVSQPGLSMLQSAPARYRAFYKKVVAVVGLGTMPLSLFMAIYSRELVLIVLGPKWIAASNIFLILSLGAFFRSVLATAGAVVITAGRSRMYLIITLSQCATLLVLLFIGVSWGPVGIAVAQSAATFAQLLPVLHYSFKDTPVKIGTFFSGIARPAAASLVMTVALIGLRSEFMIHGKFGAVVIGAMVAAIVFPVSLVLLPGGMREMKEHFSDLGAALRKKTAPA